MCEYTEIEYEKRRSTCIDQGGAAENPKSPTRQSADGQPSLAEEPRLQGREQPDAGENDTSIPQRNPRIPSASAEEPRLAYPAIVNAKLTRADGM